MGGQIPSHGYYHSEDCRLFHTILSDICTEYTVFRLPVDPSQKTILLKLNDKLYKIPHLVTGVEYISEELDPLEIEGGIVYLRSAKVDKGEVSLFSLDGKRLLYFEHLPESVSLKSLPTGAYILHLTRGNKSYRKSLYKQ